MQMYSMKNYYNVKWKYNYWLNIIIMVLKNIIFRILTFLNRLLELNSVPGNIIWKSANGNHSISIIVLFFCEM